MVDANDEARLAEIRARVEAATPGPWTAEGGTVGAYGHRAVARMSSPRNPSESHDFGDDVAYANAALIAHAREDIPYLLDQNRALQERVEALERAISDAGNLAAMPPSAGSASLDAAVRKLQPAVDELNRAVRWKPQ